MLGIFLLRTSVKRDQNLVYPPDKYLGYWSKKFKKEFGEKYFIVLNFVFGLVLVIAAIFLIIFFIKSEMGS
jgi:hypothetical protein